MTRIPFLRLTVVLALPLFAGTAFGQADQLMPPSGGGGGGQFSSRCAEGEILNGFELRVGDDVDAMRAICAAATSTKSIAARRPLPDMNGGPGGRVIQLVCPDRTPMIAGMLVGSEGRQTVIVNNLRLYCAIAAKGQLPAEFPTVAFDGPQVGSGDGLGTTFTGLPDMNMQRCPDGLVPVGINGRSGKWLDAVGFICGPLHVAAPAPNTVTSLGRVSSGNGAPRPERSICDAARDARARKSPAAANLEAQCRAQTSAAALAAVPPASAALTAQDLQQVAARGTTLASSDPLAAELRRRLANAAQRHGFDVGFGVWAANTAPGPGKQRYRDALPPDAQPGFDVAAAFSLPRHKYSVQSSVGAAIASADRAVGRARAAENDPFFLLGFDIASGIFGDRAAGAQGNTATGPGSLGIRSELNAAGQRGFDASVALHLGRKYN